MRRCLYIIILFLANMIFITNSVRGVDYNFRIIKSQVDDEYRVEDINNKGCIIGTYEVHTEFGEDRHSFLFDGDRFIPFDYPGAKETIVGGINDEGQIAGEYTMDGDLYYIFVAAPPYNIDNFRIIKSQVDDEYRVEDINNKGCIIGTYEVHTEFGEDRHSFLFDGDRFIPFDYPGAKETIVGGINDEGQIAGEYTMDGDLYYIFVAAPLKLLVVIPGWASSGGEMLTRAINMVRHDFACEVQIHEVDGLSEAQIRQKVTDAAINAKEKGKDVIVNIDMNLENLITDWKRAVEWAGRMANVVSDAFSKEVPGGRRILYAHSAGGDATFQSVDQSQGKMYDDINILNGRTNANKLKNALKRGGYGNEGWRVKIFTNDGDIWALPPIPFFRKMGSLANYRAAKRSALNGAWVHLHCGGLPSACGCPCGTCDHNGLRNCIGGAGTFEVNSRVLGTRTEVGSVEDMMTRDWR